MALVFPEQSKQFQSARMESETKEKLFKVVIFSTNKNGQLERSTIIRQLRTSEESDRSHQVGSEEIVSTTPSTELSDCQRVGEAKSSSAVIKMTTGRRMSTSQTAISAVKSSGRAKEEETDENNNVESTKAEIKEAEKMTGDGAEEDAEEDAEEGAEVKPIRRPSFTCQECCTTIDLDDQHWDGVRGCCIRELYG